MRSTLPGRNKKTKKMQGKMELELLVLEISMFSLYDFDKRVNTCSLLLSDKRVSEALSCAAPHCVPGYFCFTLSAI